MRPNKINLVSLLFAAHENDLALQVQLNENLPNYRLKLSNESFGMKPWPKGLYAMKTNDAKINKMVEEHLEDEEAFEEKYGLPEGWDIYQVLDILALTGGEFQPLTPKKTGNTPRNLGRALMQMVEAYSEPEVYIGRESGFPQTLNAFENVANWMLTHHLVSLNSTQAIKKLEPGGAFHLSSVKRLMQDYKMKL